MARTPTHYPETADRLLDREAIETPRRLSRDEHRAVAGPGWSWSQTDREDEDFND